MTHTHTHTQYTHNTHTHNTHKYSYIYIHTYIHTYICAQNDSGAPSVYLTLPLPAVCVLCTWAEGLTQTLYTLNPKPFWTGN